MASNRPPIRPKKHLGQHFLHDENIARRIAEVLLAKDYDIILEVGPGTGVLTKYLLQKNKDLFVFEVDQESVVYLQSDFTEAYLKGSFKHEFKIIPKDFLKQDLAAITQNKPFGIIGNFPYNISSQIVFKMLEFRQLIPEFAGMFQKEVAQRICESPGSKRYGILSVLVQAFYQVNYAFSVAPNVFVPPPKVDSGVIHLKRKTSYKLTCDEALFFKLVKTAFNHRRKTLRNSLKTLGLSDNLKEDTIFDRRPEQLDVAEFIALTAKVEDDTV